MSPPPPTARLRFRRWTEADLPLALALWTDPAVVARISAAPPSIEDATARLHAALEHDHQQGVQYWPIFLRATDEHVGCCGLRPWRPEERAFELGFHLRPAFHGQGYAQEAAQAVIQHAFTALGASALFAGHHPDNAASRRLLEKLGFAWTHDELYPPTGRLHPSWLLKAPRPLGGEAP